MTTRRPDDLTTIYHATLERCAPDVLVKKHVDESMPRNVVAIGKCAGLLLDGVAQVLEVESAFAAVPEGYPLPRTKAEIHIGGHPQMTPASFAAGQALLKYVDAHDDILFLVSGGGSACVEVPLAPLREDDLAELNARLLRSGASIAEINAQRKTRSAIKGGRLGQRVRGRCVTLVYSDVSSGRLEDVASGPSLRDMRLIADNDTLTKTASEIIGERAVCLGRQLEAAVDEAARTLAERAHTLREGQILVAGGEPTVFVRGDGRGGRCCELAVRFALESECEALFGSSDGVDGNSGVAGIHLPRRPQPGAPRDWQRALDVSDSLPIAAQLGEPIMITPTGNNLRDLYLVARD